MQRILAILLFALLASRLSAQVHVLAIASDPVKNYRLGKEGPTIAEGGYITVALINTSDKTLWLPSKLPEPTVFVRADKIEVYYHLGHPGGDGYQTKSGRHPWVYSRESFHPVELRPGEAMPLEPRGLPLESSKIGPFGAKPIIVSFDTKGKLAVRLGFSEVDVSNRAIPLKEYEMTPTHRREP